MLGKKKKKKIQKSETPILKQKLVAPDTKKRLFLKLMGVVGLGFVGSLLSPKKADALVFGSTPTSNVVGVKNSSNVRVNPATEETVATLATETTVASIKTGTDNLATIKTNSDKFTFDGSGNLLTASSGGSSVVGIKNASDVRINPATQETLALVATDENILLLRRIARQIDSLAVVDSAQRQKITLDSISASLTLGTITTVTTVSSLTSATNLVALGGVDGRYLYIDTARNAYANGIRNNL